MYKYEIIIVRIISIKDNRADIQIEYKKYYDAGDKQTNLNHNYIQILKIKYVYLFRSTNNFEW